MTTASPYQLLPIGQVHESKHNPRQHFDGPALEQLAENIRMVGILEPLTVRPTAKGYEIASGHRRYRAAKAIGLEELPCMVREMTDQVFMEALTISNLQREDVHPLDEARGYEDLMAAPYKMDVHRIAERVGKSVKYIYDRIKLLALIKEARDFFWSGKISAGHAILLARLTPSEQKKALGTEADGYGGVFQAEKGLPFESEIPQEEQFKAVSVREFEAWIDDHIRFDRKTIDPMLFPETAAKIAARSEIPNAKILPITHSYILNEDTRREDERTYGSASWKRADGQDESKACEHAQLGLIVAGAHRGDSFEVCVQKKKCRIHWKEEVAAAQAREKGDLKTARKAETIISKRQKDYEAQRQREEEARANWKRAIPAILQATADRIKRMPITATGLLADLILEECDASNGYFLKQAQQFIPHGKKVEDLIRLAAFIPLVKEVDDEWRAAHYFPKRAKALGIDLPKLLKASTPDPSADKSVEGKKPAKKRGKGKAA